MVLAEKIRKIFILQADASQTERLGLRMTIWRKFDVGLPVSCVCWTVSQLHF